MIFNEQIAWLGKILDSNNFQYRPKLTIENHLYNRVPSFIKKLNRADNTELSVIFQSISNVYRKRALSGLYYDIKTT